MAVLPADLKAANGGRLEPSLLFPDEDATALDQRLQKYIDQGVVRAAGLTGTELDDAVALWAYHRAFEAVWVRLSSNPANVDLRDQGSASYLREQIQNFKDLSDAALEEFVDAVPEAAAADGDWPAIRSHRREMIG